MFDYKDTSFDGSVWKAVCSVSADLSYFKGHFPAKPILPAIAQLKMLEGFVSQIRNSPHCIESAASIKFVQPITPADMIMMELKFISDFETTFRLFCSGVLVSRGQLTFRLPV